MAEVSLDFSALETRPTTLQLTSQQAIILGWVEDPNNIILGRELRGFMNAVIIAVAGAGKTSTLIEALSIMRGTVAFCAYNKAISLEILDKVKARGIGSAVKVGTFHSFGYRAWIAKHRDVDLKPDKIRDLCRSYKHKGAESMPESMHEFVEKLVSLVRSSAVGITCPINKNDAWEAIIAHHALDDLLTGKKPWEENDMDPDELRALVDKGKVWALRILRESIRMAQEKKSIIDFDDQLYMPLYEGLYIQQYDWVLVDEAQDTNPIRLAFAKAMLAVGGRFLAVGDPKQAIYGFTGADSQSLETIREEFGTVQLDLTVSFRCPKAVVREAQQFASHIQSAENAIEGEVINSTIEDMMLTVSNATNKELEASAILCRKNAPIVGLAFSLLRSRIPCHVEGRDIGASIKTLPAKWPTIKKLIQILPLVEAYRQREVQKFMAKGQEMRADAMHDRCDTFKALADGLLRDNLDATVDELFRQVDQMFRNDDKTGLTLASVHRSKGREWETVYILGRFQFMPSPFARQEWQLDQEENLQYVAITRSKRTLIDVPVPTKRDRE